MSNPLNNVQATPCCLHFRSGRGETIYEDSGSAPLHFAVLALSCSFCAAATYRREITLELCFTSRASV
jgi:hypothetical protein